MLLGDSDDLVAVNQLHELQYHGIWNIWDILSLSWQDFNMILICGRKSSNWRVYSITR